jgi:hypothetical protein
MKTGLFLQLSELALPVRRGPARRRSNCSWDDPERPLASSSRPGLERSYPSWREPLPPPPPPPADPRPPPPLLPALPPAPASSSAPAGPRTPLPRGEEGARTLPKEPGKSQNTKGRLGAERPRGRRCGRPATALPARVRPSPRSPPLPSRVSALGSGTGRLSLGRAVTSPGHRLRSCLLPEVSLRTAGHAHTRTHAPRDRSIPRTRTAFRPARSSTHMDAVLQHPQPCAQWPHVCIGNASLTHTLERLTQPSLTHARTRPLQPTGRSPFWLHDDTHQPHPKSPLCRAHAVPAHRTPNLQTHSALRPALRISVYRPPPITHSVAHTQSLPSGSPVPLSPRVRKGFPRPRLTAVLCSL